MTVGRLVDRLRETLVGYRMVPPADDGDCDLFKPLYQDLFPRPLRHQLGEYYTPDWLAGHVLDQVGYTGEPGQRLLDPACGSGTFLLLALRRRKRREEGGEGERDQQSPINHQGPLSPLLSSLSPRGLRPKSVGRDDGRANYLIATADLLPEHDRVELPIYLRDSILGNGDVGEASSEPFDFVVGNPPWIAWDNLPGDDRQATKPLWERYGLFSLSGNAARHGGGKKDLSMLMLYAAADRYLEARRTIGHGDHANALSDERGGRWFPPLPPRRRRPAAGVLRVDDMVALRPFGDAANWTSTIVLQKGAATEYPVPYYTWEQGRGNDECEVMNDECDVVTRVRRAGPSIHHSSFRIHHFHARPIDPAKPTSPWLIEKASERFVADKSF